MPTKHLRSDHIYFVYIMTLGPLQEFISKGVEVLTKHLLSDLISFEYKITLGPLQESASKGLKVLT